MDVTAYWRTSVTVFSMKLCPRKTYDFMPSSLNAGVMESEYQAKSINRDSGINQVIRKSFESLCIST